MLNFHPPRCAIASLFAVLALNVGSSCVFGQISSGKPDKNEAQFEAIASPESELGAASGVGDKIPATAPAESSSGEQSRGNDYWKTTPDSAQPVEYEKLDAETARDRFNTKSVEKLRKPMRQIRIVAEEGPSAPRNLANQFMQKEPVLTIVAAGISPPLPDRYPIQFKHRPLYYEQPRLERCGRGCGPAQNAISVGQFCVNTFFLPYHMCKTRPDCLVSSGGDCLSCKPYAVDCNPFPVNYRGLATEAAAFAGFSFLLL